MLPSETANTTTNGHSLNGMAMATPITHRDKIRKMARISLSSSPAPDAEGGAVPAAGQERENRPCTDFDVAYFQSYSHLGIHEEIIKVVVDVGCGTGILSIFCAQAGARRVSAVDASDIAVQANEVVKANKLSDTVKVLHGRVECLQ